MTRSAGPLDAQPAVDPAPLSEAQRIGAIDALRGVALFGVLMVNLTTEFRVSIFRQFVGDDAGTTIWDRLASQFVTTALEMKAFSLFSLLFGIGLAIQFERLSRRSDRTLLIFRRIAVLLALGLIHLFLIWNGDILTEYAVAGFIVLPLLYAPTPAVAGVTVVSLAFYAVMPLLKLPIPFPSHHWIRHHLAEAAIAYGHGNLGRVVAFNAAEVRSLVSLHLFVLPRTIGLFGAGIWLWRVKFFDAKLHALALPLALAALLFGLLLTRWASSSSPPPFSEVASQLAPMTLAAGYSGAVLWLGTSKRTAQMVMWAAPLGRMAFTNYVAQSLIFGWIFFGYGLALFNRLPWAQAFGLGLAVYVLQVVASGFWLRRFLFGPLEWLWRSAMYGRLQPMRKSRLRTENKTVAV
jgi:uncharacterized protein